METSARSTQLTDAEGRFGGRAGAGGGRNGGQTAEDERDPSPEPPPSPPPVINQENPPPSTPPQQKRPPVPNPPQKMLKNLLAAVCDMRQQNQQLQAQMHHLQAEQDVEEDEWQKT